MGRKSREEIDKSDYDLLKPLDILSLGGEDDPCFGKLHDLKAEECQQCGDSEFCAIVKAQNLHKERLKIESQQRLKDVEEASEELLKKRKKARKFIDKCKEQGRKRLKTILQTCGKFNLPKDIVTKLYDEL